TRRQAPQAPERRPVRLRATRTQRLALHTWPVPGLPRLAPHHRASLARGGPRLLRIPCPAPMSTGLAAQTTAAGVLHYAHLQPTTLRGSGHTLFRASG